MLLTKQNIPRWSIFLIDSLIILFSVILAYLLRFNFRIPETELITLPKILCFMLGVRVLSFIIAKTYAGIIRYTSTQDAVRIFLVILSGSILFIISNIISYYFINHKFLIPFSIIIIEFITVIFSMTTFRILIKIAYLELLNPSKEKINVIIYGAGEAGIITKKTLDRDAGTKYKVLTFIDDDVKKIGKTLEGVTILGYNKLKNLLETNSIAHVIISIQKLKSEKKKEIVDMCLTHNTKVLTLPPVARWINGELSFKQIKKIKIENLLEREVIKLDEYKIREELTGKNILITGASGSIGSELVRQIAKYSPKKLILIDQAESSLFQLEIECYEKYPSKKFEIVVADICNKVRIENTFKTYKPEIVYHAAAYKHVPMMENNPSEAINTNIKGTKIIADMSVKYNVEKFIMVSTDKAVNPTSVMGATKRVAEIYTQSLNKNKITRFIITRFGNVLGSNGSVIPLFRKQIEKGGPITITHPEITRFFMTIPEACQLVLEAGTMGKGGEIYIFDMGKSVKIVDLVKKMVKLSGLTLGKDIQIKYTGLRPGEKLYEELLNNEENTLPTHHPQIMIAKVKEYDPDIISKEIDELIELFIKQNNFEIVKKMKKIIPEYISKNSIYEQLDKLT
ncbi:MAG: polysaccharide biosynthesis protein [Bacteroidales bacterium]|nr:polysaccharide biosynthesis protein [Bacteroidales bacterium]